MRTVNPLIQGPGHVARVEPEERERVLNSVLDPYHFDADPDPTFYADNDPDPDPNFLARERRNQKIVNIFPKSYKTCCV